MKRAILLLFWVAASSACTVPNDSSIRFVGTRSLKPGGGTGGVCQAAELQSLGGSLDLAGFSNYVIQLNIESNLQSIVTNVPEAVAGSSRNDFIAKYLQFSYQSTPPVSFQTEQQVISMVIKAGSTAQSFLQTFLFTPQAVGTLYANVAVGGSLDVNVTVQLFGELASGQKMSTNKLTYPIRVYRSSFAGCPSDDIQAPTGPCGYPGGQDGTDVACCKYYKTVKLTPPAGCPTTT
jgi:hypothetical protein